MDEKKITESARKVLATMLKRELPAGVEVSRAQEPTWDSLKHVELIFALEEEFGVQFTEDEMAALSSLSAITQIVGRRLAA